MSAKLVTVLGSTGSIGASTLDVIRVNPERFKVFALSANRQNERLLEQCLEFRPEYAVLQDEPSAAKLRQSLRRLGAKTEVLSGEQGLLDIAGAEQPKVVVAAIVGAAGLDATLCAVRSGKRVLLANKESLVMCGRLLTDAVRDSGAELLPVDSEHNAIFQCLPAGYIGLEEAGVRRIHLTGSGGPFRDSPLSELPLKTPAEACAHPNWSMGRKISVDSATMMNKGLELIEACWLFKAVTSDIQVVIHPQSVVHSMVEYMDGSVIAQMGVPDMRIPIASCLGWPERIESKVPGLDFYQLSHLDFEAPDYRRFPALRLCMEAMASAADYPVALNAANEMAVEAFLSETICFTHIAEIIEEILNIWSAGEPVSLAAVKDADQRARSLASDLISKRAVR